MRRSKGSVFVGGGSGSSGGGSGVPASVALWRMTTGAAVMLGSVMTILTTIIVVDGAVVKSYPPPSPPQDLTINLRPNEKHPLEDVKSWKMQLERQHNKASSEARHVDDEGKEGGDDVDDDDDPRRRTRTRRLATYVEVEGDETTPYTVLHKKLKKHLPFAGGDTTHGIMIDAGSQGTRLHIYEWNKRILLDQDDLLETVHGQKLSIPTSNSRWTDKYLPGLDVFASYKDESKLLHHLEKYLGPLIDFAKTVLQDKDDQWSSYPIYLKATGGLRTLPQHDRVRIMNGVRKLFNDPNFNPFSFEDERARVISGEEEAIYGWVGVNFALGTLIKDSTKKGGVGGTFINPKLTYGMVEMGGASTQIAFFENSRDLMANLFKLQLGASRHWNVYVHSYLYAGINGAFSRLNGKIFGQNSNINPCLPIGSEFAVDSWIHADADGRFFPRSANESVQYTTTMVSKSGQFDVNECSNQTYRLLRKDANEEWCDFEMDGNCAFAGIYQPPMPKITDETTEFVATSNFVDVFEFLNLGERANISEIGKSARQICTLTWEELKEYDKKQQEQHDEDSLKQMCFRSLFVYHLLADGWGFGDNYTLNAVDVINGQKLGWALGCMLYEINTLPWDFHPELLYRGRTWWQIAIYVILGSFGGGTFGFIVAMRMSKKFNKKVRESKFFKNLSFANNPIVRKSLSLPNISEELSDLQRLYDDDEQQAERELLKEGNGTTKGVSYDSTGGNNS